MAELDSFSIVFYVASNVVESQSIMAFIPIDSMLFLGYFPLSCSKQSYPHAEIYGAFLLAK